MMSKPPTSADRMPPTIAAKACLSVMVAVRMFRSLTPSTKSRKNGHPRKDDPTVILMTQPVILGRMTLLQSPERTVILGRMTLRLQNPGGDDEALDFGGAFVDFGDSGVAVVALDGIFAAVAVAAVDLDGFVGDARGHFADEEFGDVAFEPCGSFLGKVQYLRLLLEEDLDSGCGPDSDARAEEIGVFSPYWAGQGESGGEHRPVAFVATAQSLTGFDFKGAIKFRCDGLDQAAQVFESRTEVSLGFVPFL